MLTMKRNSAEAQIGIRRVCGGAAALFLAFGSMASAQVKDGTVRILQRRDTGLATFVTGVDRKAISVQPAAGKTAVEPIDFLRQRGELFGVTDPAQQLRVTKTLSDGMGQTHTTYQQFHQGVRVFGGILKVHQNAAGEVLAANGNFFPMSPRLVTAPSKTVDQAEAAARRLLAPTMPAGANPVIERSELVIVDPGWYGDPPAGARLAYYLILTDLEAGVREAFFVDAHSAEILDHWNIIHTARDRVVIRDAACDGATQKCLGGINDGLPCANNAQCRAVARTEGEGPTGDTDVDQAYDYSGDTYDFFARAFGRDGMDDAGGTMTATAHLVSSSCPNAFGGAGGTFFCAGLATDDIVGHEWGHAVTAFTAQLIYQNQTGQLNESYSDVWGEVIDLYNGDAIFPGAPGGTPWPPHPSGPGLDTPNDMRGTGCDESLRWLVAEGSALDVIRDMWNPTCFSDPDRANSPLETCNPNDNGGVHSGSGVPNHAFAMLVDGQTFNGFTINPIGPFKAGAVWYRALTVYMTTITDFQDAYFSFLQAANDLVGSTPNDPRTGTPSASAFTTADVAEVKKALLATEMNTAGLCGFNGRVMLSDTSLLCPGRSMIFSDDFESGVGAWTVSNTAPPTPYDWALTTGPLPFDEPGVAFLVEDRNIGDCGGQDESAVHTLQSPSIVLPADADFPMLSFSHYLRSQGGFDGGNVSIRVNGGAWQKVSRNDIVANTYNGILTAAGLGNTNPLAGEVAWTGSGGQWGTSIVDLSNLAGPNDTIDIRFDFGKDGCDGLIGWYLDDVEVFNCPDCDASNEADIKEIRHSFASPPLLGIGAGAPQSFTITSPPPAGSDVSLLFTAFGDFNVNTEFVNVKLNGTQVGQLFPFLVTTDCAPTPDVAEILVDATTFNTLVGGGNATIDMIASGDVSAAACGGAPYITVVVSYGTAGAAPDPNPIAKNRYVTLNVGGSAGREMAIRAVLKNLPPPFDCHNGEEMWVGAPRNITEVPGQNDDTLPVFKGAELVSFPTLFDSGGIGLLHIYGREVIPNAEYEFQTFDASCGVMFSAPSGTPIAVRTTDLWGDVAGAFQNGQWTAPNNDVSVITDCVAILDKFSDLTGAPIKARADLEPDPPDQKINIGDVIFCLEGFQGFDYPFGGPQPPCP